jgi:hypothetical protein
MQHAPGYSVKYADLPAYLWVFYKPCERIHEGTDLMRKCTLGIRVQLFCASCMHSFRAVLDQGLCCLVLTARSEEGKDEAPSSAPRLLLSPLQACRLAEACSLAAFPSTTVSDLEEEAFLLGGLAA